MSYDPDQLRELVLVYYQEGKDLERATQRWSPCPEIKPRPSRATFYRAKARADEAFVAQIEDWLREQPGASLQACLDELSLPWARTTLSRRLRARGWMCLPDAGWLQVGTQDETNARFEPEDALLIISCQDQVLILDRQQRVTCLGPRASCLGELAAVASAHAPERSWLKLLAWGATGQTPQALLAQLRARHGGQEGSIRLDEPLMTWLLAATMDAQRHALATPHWRALGDWLARLWLAYGLGVIGALEQAWDMLHDGCDDLGIWDKTPAWCKPGWRQELCRWGPRGPWRALEALYPALGAWRVQMMTRVWFHRRTLLTHAPRSTKLDSPLWEQAAALGLPRDLLTDDALALDASALDAWLEDMTQRSALEQELGLTVFYELAYWARTTHENQAPVLTHLLAMLEGAQRWSSPGASARAGLRNIAGLYERRLHRPLQALDHYLSAVGESGLSHHALRIIGLIYNVRIIYEELLEEDQRAPSVEALKEIDAIFEEEIRWSLSSAQSQLSSARDAFFCLKREARGGALDSASVLTALEGMSRAICEAICMSVQSSYEQELIITWVARLLKLFQACRSCELAALEVSRLDRLSDKVLTHLKDHWKIPEGDPRDLRAMVRRIMEDKAHSDDLKKVLRLLDALDGLSCPTSWDELSDFLEKLAAA